MEAVRDFLLLGSKTLRTVTTAMKLRYVLLGRKAMTNLDSVLRSRDITLLPKSMNESYGFPVVMYGCGSQTIKKTECQRIHVFELWCWKRLLRVPWTVRRSNKSTLQEINPEYSLERLMLKMKRQYFGYLMQRANSLMQTADSLEKTLMLQKTDSRRGNG